MNRCPSPPVPRADLSGRRRAALLRVLACTLALGPWTSLPARAQTEERVRVFPAGVQRGTLEIVQAPQVLLDGAEARLSPGARIRDENNLLALPAALTGRRLVVHYKRDRQGLLHELWVLNATEARQPRPAAAPDASSTP